MEVAVVKRGWVVVTVCVGVFMASLDLFIVTIAFPSMLRTFRGATLRDLSWVLSAYAIVFGALLVPLGRWADRVGRKRVFMLGLGLFTLSSAACAVTTSVETLVAGRALQAVGAAMLYPTSLGLLLPLWPSSKRGAAVGIWSAVAGVAGAAGPPLGGLILQAGWRWVFIVNVPIGIVALLATQRLVRAEPADTAAGRPDLVGAVSLALAAAALILAIVQGPTWGWGGSRVIGLFMEVVGFAIVVVWCSVRHPAPIIDPVIVRTRAILFANLASLMFFMAFATLLLTGTLFQQTVWHVSVLRAGIQFAPGPFTSALVAFPAALLGARIGQRYVGALGALLVCASAVWFRTHAGVHPEFASTLLPWEMLGGVGIGFVLPTLSAGGTGPLPPALFATGTAVLGLTRQVGSALGIAAFVVIVAAATPATVVGDFRTVADFQAVCGLLAAGALVAIGTIRPHAAAQARSAVVPMANPGPRRTVNGSVPRVDAGSARRTRGPQPVAGTTTAVATTPPPTV
jgi:EmrB/QacA subfamily drug resistance transporter